MRKAADLQEATERARRDVNREARERRKEQEKERDEAARNEREEAEAEEDEAAVECSLFTAAVEAALLTAGEEPRSYREAVRSAERDDWQRAMEEEYDALLKNKTWELVKPPKGRKPIGSKWTYKAKQDGRFKAQLVAQGFTQRPGVDFYDTHSPVARFESF